MVGPRGPTLGTCAWYRFTCVYCYHIFIFKVCGMTYDWWRMCNTMELGSNSSHREFFLSNNHIQTTSITKDLGAQFESNLKFKACINDIVNSAHQRSALIYRSFFHVTLIIWFWRSKLMSDPCSNTSHRCGPKLMSYWSALLRLSNWDLPRDC